MTFSQAVRNCFRHYASGKGRAGRAEYFWWLLFTAIVGVVAAVLDVAAGTEGFTAVAYLGSLLPSVAVGIRRLHDIDRAGPWMFIALVPIIGPIVLLVFFLKKGTPGANRFGEQPGAPAAAEAWRAPVEP